MQVSAEDLTFSKRVLVSGDVTLAINGGVVTASAGAGGAGIGGSHNYTASKGENDLLVSLG